MPQYTALFLQQHNIVTIILCVANGVSEVQLWLWRVISSSEQPVCLLPPHSSSLCFLLLLQKQQQAEQATAGFGSLERLVERMGSFCNFPRASRPPGTSPSYPCSPLATLARETSSDFQGSSNCTFRLDLMASGICHWRETGSTRELAQCVTVTEIFSL